MNILYTVLLIKLTAAGLFLIALAINIKVTLDDPFVMMSEQAIATGSSTNGTNGTNGTGGTATMYYTPEPYDCNIVYSGTGNSGAGIDFKMFGQKWKVPANWNFDVKGDFIKKYEDVAMNCKINGEYLCKLITCLDVHKALRSN